MFATLLLLQILTLTDWILGQASSHDYKMMLLPCCLAVWMNNQLQAIIIHGKTNLAAETQQGPCV